LQWVALGRRRVASARGIGGVFIGLRRQTVAEPDKIFDERVFGLSSILYCHPPKRYVAVYVFEDYLRI